MALLSCSHALGAAYSRSVGHVNINSSAAVATFIPAFRDSISDISRYLGNSSETGRMKVGPPSAAYKLGYISFPSSWC
jgi:hypothetical protein